MSNENNDCKSKREKRHGFENQPQWVDLIQAMLKEKEVQNVMNEFRADLSTAIQTNKKAKDNAVASKIIK